MTPKVDLNSLNHLLLRLISKQQTLKQMIQTNLQDIYKERK